MKILKKDQLEVLQNLEKITKFIKELSNNSAKYGKISAQKSWNCKS